MNDTNGTGNAPAETAAMETKKNETEAEGGEEPQEGADQAAAEAQAPPPLEPKFRIIISIGDHAALVGLQGENLDPHIEVAESTVPEEVVAVLPEILQRARERWNRNPKNRGRATAKRQRKPDQVRKPATRQVQAEPEGQTKLALL